MLAPKPSSFCHTLLRASPRISRANPNSSLTESNNFVTEIQIQDKIETTNAREKSIFRPRGSRIRKPKSLSAAISPHYRGKFRPPPAAVLSRFQVPASRPFRYISGFPANTDQSPFQAASFTGLPIEKNFDEQTTYQTR